MKDDKTWVLKCIKACNTEDQLANCHKLIETFEAKWIYKKQDPSIEVQELKDAVNAKLMNLPRFEILMETIPTKVIKTIGYKGDVSLDGRTTLLEIITDSVNASIIFDADEGIILSFLPSKFEASLKYMFEFLDDSKIFKHSLFQAHTWSHMTITQVRTMKAFGFELDEDGYWTLHSVSSGQAL